MTERTRKVRKMSNRFSRTEQLIGKEALAKLKHARVAVFGLGAVGSYAVEALARAGIGFLRLVDCDCIRPSNMNRQLYALESTLNRPKAEVARERVLDINPDCTVNALQAFVMKKTLDQLLSKPLDAIVDAIDSVTPKVELIAAAVRAGLPVISSMGAATRTEPSAIRIGDISETDVCPLARFVRKRLRQRGISHGVRCIFSVEEPSNTAVPIDVEEESFHQGRLRRPIGSLSYITGIFGLLAAYEVIKIVIPIQRKILGKKRTATETIKHCPAKQKGTKQ
jgi:tRNA A37 threonylcarbamoyladenosine dehydratase